MVVVSNQFDLLNVSEEADSHRRIPVEKPLKDGLASQSSRRRRNKSRAAKGTTQEDQPVASEKSAEPPTREDTADYKPLINGKLSSSAEAPLGNASSVQRSEQRSGENSVFAEVSTGEKNALAEILDVWSPAEEVPAEHMKALLSEVAPTTNSRQRLKVKKSSNDVVEATPLAQGVTQKEVKGPKELAEEEAVALEDAAVMAGANQEMRLHQWYDWTLRAQSPPGAAPRFGNQTWKQVFLGSRALELTLKACLQPPLLPAHRHNLQMLLRAFLESQETAQVLASVAVDLAQGLASGPQDETLAQAAKQALASSLTAFKEGDNGWAVKGLKARLEASAVRQELTNLDAQVAHAEQQLQALSSQGDPSATLAECSQWSAELVRLSTARLALMLPIESPGLPSGSAQDASPADVAIQSIRKLADCIGQHKRFNKLPSAKTKGERQSGVESSHGAGESHLAELQHLAGALDQEAATLRAQLAAAQAEVGRLHAAANEVEARRQNLEAHLQLLAQNGKSANGVGAEEKVTAPAGMAAAGGELWVAQQLGTVHTLESLLLRPQEGEAGHAASPGESTVLALMGHAVEDHLQSLAGHLANKQRLQIELKQRMWFCQAKIAPMEEQVLRLRQLGKTKLASELSRPMEGLEKMLKARQAEAAALLEEVAAAEAHLQRAVLRTAIAMLPPQQPVHALLQQISHILHQIRAEHAAMLAGPAKSEDSASSAPGVGLKPAKKPNDKARGAKKGSDKADTSTSPAGQREKESKANQEKADPDNDPPVEPPPEELPSVIQPVAQSAEAAVPNAWARTMPKSQSDELAELGFQEEEQDPGGSEEIGIEQTTPVNATGE